MAKRIDYRTVNRRKTDQYIFPEEDDASLKDALIPAAEMALFFTKPGQKLTGAIFGAGAKAAGGIGKWGRARGKGLASWSAGGGPRRGADFLTVGIPKKVSPMINKIMGKDYSPMGAAFKAKGKQLGAEGAALGRGALKFGKFMAKRPGLIGGLAIGAGLIFGGIKGLKPSPITLKEDIGRGGPDINQYLKTKGGRLRTGHLGATGDLTLSLHNGR